jgi:hypothetical protein
MWAAQDRLVLRAKKIGYYVGGGVLAVMGAALAAAGFLAIAPNNTGTGVGLGVFGLLLLAGAVALVRSGTRNSLGIEVDHLALLSCREVLEDLELGLIVPAVLDEAMVEPDLTQHRR